MRREFSDEIRQLLETGYDEDIRTHQDLISANDVYYSQLPDDQRIALEPDRININNAHLKMIEQAQTAKDKSRQTFEKAEEIDKKYKAEIEALGLDTDLYINKIDVLINSFRPPDSNDHYPMNTIIENLQNAERTISETSVSIRYDYYYIRTDRWKELLSKRQETTIEEIIVSDEDYDTLFMISMNCTDEELEDFIRLMYDNNIGDPPSPENWKMNQRLQTQIQDRYTQQISTLQSDYYDLKNTPIEDLIAIFGDAYREEPYRQQLIDAQNTELARIQTELEKIKQNQALFTVAGSLRFYQTHDAKAAEIVGGALQSSGKALIDNADLPFLKEWYLFPFQPLPLVLQALNNATGKQAPTAIGQGLKDIGDFIAYFYSGPIPNEMQGQAPDGGPPIHINRHVNSGTEDPLETGSFVITYDQDETAAGSDVTRIVEVRKTKNAVNVLGDVADIIIAYVDPTYTSGAAIEAKVESYGVKKIKSKIISKMAKTLDVQIDPTKATKVAGTVVPYIGDVISIAYDIGKQEYNAQQQITEASQIEVIMINAQYCTLFDMQVNTISIPEQPAKSSLIISPGLDTDMRVHNYNLWVEGKLAAYEASIESAEGQVKADLESQLESQREKYKTITPDDLWTGNANISGVLDEMDDKDREFLFDASKRPLTEEEINEFQAASTDIKKNKILRILTKDES